MPISKKISDYLKKKKYKYEIIEHKTTYTAWDTARTTQKKEKKTKIDEIVKALVLRADREHFLALVSANRRLDKKKLLRIVNARRRKAKLPAFKKIDFAKEVWMKKNIPGKVGATPPFREILGIEIFMDSLAAKQKNLYIGSGEYEYSIKIPAKQYLKSEELVIGAFGAKNDHV